MNKTPHLIAPAMGIEYYYNGLLHRVDGPAVILKNGIRIWYYNGLLHREDGPAISGKPPGWYVHGQNVQNFEEYQQLVGCSDEIIFYYVLKYGTIHE